VGGGPLSQVEIKAKGLKKKERTDEWDGGGGKGGYRLPSGDIERGKKKRYGRRKKTDGKDYFRNSWQKEIPQKDRKSC